MFEKIVKFLNHLDSRVKLLGKKSVKKQIKLKIVEIDPKEIGQIGGGKDKRTGLLDIAMLQKFVQKYTSV